MERERSIDGMTPDEEQEYIDKINEDFKYYIEVIPFIELGDTPGMQLRKLRTHVHEGKYSIAEIFFELQRELYIRKLNHPNVKGMIVSELELTPVMYDPNCFCPIRGVMIKMKYVTDELFI
jgi:hypothetical protein